MNTPIGRLRTIGFLEGTSFLILLGIAMPLKKFAGIPEAVTIVGWIHGLLFMLFVAAVFQVSAIRKWSVKRILGALAASVIPFGPVVLDAWLRREEREAENR